MHGTNLHLSGVGVVGGLIGVVTQSIRIYNCSTDGSITSGEVQGGIVGDEGYYFQSGTQKNIIEDCHTTMKMLRSKTCSSFIDDRYWVINNSVSKTTCQSQYYELHNVAMINEDGSGIYVGTYGQEEIKLSPNQDGYINKKNWTYVNTVMNQLAFNSAGEKAIGWDRLLNPTRLLVIQTNFAGISEQINYIPFNLTVKYVPAVQELLAQNFVLTFTDDSGTVLDLYTHILSNMTLHIQYRTTHIYILSNYKINPENDQEIFVAFQNIRLCTQWINDVVILQYSDGTYGYDVPVASNKAEEYVTMINRLTQESCSHDLWCQQVLVTVERTQLVQVTQPINQEILCQVGSTFETLNLTWDGFVYVNHATNMPVSALNVPIIENITLIPSFVVQLSGLANDVLYARYGITLAEIPEVNQYLTSAEYVVSSNATGNVYQCTVVLSNMTLHIYQKDDPTLLPSTALKVGPIWAVCCLLYMIMLWPI